MHLDPDHRRGVLVIGVGPQEAARTARRMIHQVAHLLQADTHRFFWQRGLAGHVGGQIVDPHAGQFVEIRQIRRDAEAGQAGVEHRQGIFGAVRIIVAHRVDHPHLQVVPGLGQPVDKILEGAKGRAQGVPHLVEPAAVVALGLEKQLVPRVPAELGANEARHVAEHHKAVALIVVAEVFRARVAGQANLRRGDIRRRSRIGQGVDIDLNLRRLAGAHPHPGRQPHGLAGGVQQHQAHVVAAPLGHAGHRPGKPRRFLLVPKLQRRTQLNTCRHFRT